MTWCTMNENKKILKQIKKYDTIVIARHIGADPDALGSQLALKEAIKNTFPNKKVYAVGALSAKFKYMGLLDTGEVIEDEEKLLIVLDTPDKRRIDDANPEDYSYVIKIDHHPFIEKFGGIEIIDESSSSTCQLIIKFLLENKLKITPSMAENLYTGIIGDTDRFLHDYTTVNTFDLVTKLLKQTNINFTALYEPLYSRPFAEVRFQGYIYQNLKLNQNGLAYIKLTNDILKEYGVDSASAGNMINNLKFVSEIKIWVFLSEDINNNIIRANIRSNGPIINGVASAHGGGGHKYSSGVRMKTWDEADSLLYDLDKLLQNYNDEK